LVLGAQAQFEGWQKVQGLKAMHRTQGHKNHGWARALLAKVTGVDLAGPLLGCINRGAVLGAGNGNVAAAVLGMQGVEAGRDTLGAPREQHLVGTTHIVQALLQNRSGLGTHGSQLQRSQRRLR
jgi:hypothetical protein